MNATHTPTLVTISKCLCGQPSCRDHWLSNGKFCQGSGFDKEEAERVARACNAHDDLVAALKMARIMIRNDLLENAIVGGATFPKLTLGDVLDAALAKAGAA